MPELTLRHIEDAPPPMVPFPGVFGCREGRSQSRAPPFFDFPSGCFGCKTEKTEPCNHRKKVALRGLCAQLTMLSSWLTATSIRAFKLRGCLQRRGDQGGVDECPCYDSPVVDLKSGDPWVPVAWERALGAVGFLHSGFPTMDTNDEGEVAPPLFCNAMLEGASLQYFLTVTLTFSKTRVTNRPPLLRAWAGSQGRVDLQV